MGSQVVVSMGVSSFFLMWEGHFFVGGVGVLSQKIFKIVDFYTQNNLPLSLFFLGAGMVCTDYYYVLV